MNNVNIKTKKEKSFNVRDNFFEDYTFVDLFLSNILINHEK